MLTNPLLVDRNNEESLANWLHLNWPWQLAVTIRTPQLLSADKLRRQIASDLIRPLAKFARTMILGVGAFTRDPAPHVHLLLYSKAVDLSVYCSHDERGRPIQDGLDFLESLRGRRRDPLSVSQKDLHIQRYRDSGASRYFAKNLCRDPRGLNGLWTFGQRLLDKDRGAPPHPLVGMFFGEPVVPNAA